MYSGSDDGNDIDREAWANRQLKKATAAAASATKQLSEMEASINSCNMINNNGCNNNNSGGSQATSQLTAIQLLSSRPGVNYQAESIMKRLRDRYGGGVVGEGRSGRWLCMTTWGVEVGGGGGGVWGVGVVAYERDYYSSVTVVVVNDSSRRQPRGVNPIAE